MQTFSDDTSKFIKFKSEINQISLPQKFTFPFYYETHPLCSLAANEIQEYLLNQTDFEHNFGIDDYDFSKKFKTIAHCEINPELSSIVKHNFAELQVRNCIFHADDSSKILQSSDGKWDWIYVDPSRRHDA